MARRPFLGKAHCALVGFYPLLGFPEQGRKESRNTGLPGQLRLDAARPEEETGNVMAQREDLGRRHQPRLLELGS